MPIPVSNNATITMSIDDFRNLEKELDQLRAEIAKHLDVPLPGPQAGDPEVIDSFYSAMEIVRFAVGNLNPESYRGWPTDALGKLADQIELLFPGDQNWLSTAIAFRELASEAIDADALRLRRQKAAEVLTSVLDTTQESAGESAGSS